MLGAHSLEALVKQAGRLEGVRKTDLRSGDWVLVTTLNSLYSIYVLGDGNYRVTGGWFDREGKAPATIAINGCTWGGRAIKSDMVAARGLCLEFGNWVITTRIQKIRIVRSPEQEIRVQ